MASFPRTKRLTESHAFNEVFKAPATRIIESKLMLLARPNGLASSRLGLAISKRHVKLSCGRNRVKRVIRASFSQHAQLPSMDIVILSRAGLLANNKALLWQQLQALWTRLLAC